jgi:toxin YoeB
MTMSEKVWSDDAWADYLYWQTQDKKTLKRINLLIKDIERNGVPSGIEDPEALRGSLRGEFSHRINEKDRLVYHIEDGRIYVVSCRGHYDNK